MKNIGLIWQVVFKLGYLFLKGGRNELGEKSQGTVILGKFVNKTKLSLAYSFQKMFFIGRKLKKACLHDIFFSWTFDLPLVQL